MRRDFDSRAAGLCACDDVFGAAVLIRPMLRGMIAPGEVLLARWPNQNQETKVDHGPYRI
jgi:hypothetical protein